MVHTVLKKPVRRNRETGFSAIELLIAMAIFLVVMASVYGILKIGNMSRTTVNSRSENIKNVRLAINSIGREAVNAGLGYNRVGGIVPDDFTSYTFGLPADPDSDYDLLTAISAGNNITETDLSKTGEKNDVVAFSFRDFQFNDGFPIVIKDVIDNGTSLILKTPDGACASCRPYDLFLIETSEGRQAVILSTDIVDDNQIVLDSSADPINIDYGKSGKNLKDAQKKLDDAQKKLDDALHKVADEQKHLADEQQKLADAIAKGDANKIVDEQKKVADAQQKVTDALQNVADAQKALAAAQAALNSSSHPTGGSVVKKCTSSITTNCIDYASTSVVAKKIYLVSYSVNADGTLVRTTYGNNTGASADDQIFTQPIANGVRSFKIHYLLSDGTVTDDPSVANTQKERCNDIIQIEVSITVESETNQNGVVTSDPIVLTSTFSTRNLKYDSY